MKKFGIEMDIYIFLFVSTKIFLNYCITYVGHTIV
jgi:hypothetical protein